MNTLTIFRWLPLAVLAFSVSCAPARAGGSPEPWAPEILALEDARSADPALRAWLEDPRPPVRARAALALGRIGDTADLPLLVSHIHDADASVRGEIAFALGELEDSTAAASLIAITGADREQDPEVRALAVEALGKIHAGAAACVRALSDPAARVRSAALLAAWQIPAPAALPRVLELASSDDPETRWRAAYCLMRFMGAPASGRTPIPGGIALTPAQKEQGAGRLRALIADSDPRVRVQAARGLRSVVDEELRQALLRCRDDADWRVRVEAIRALAGHARPVAEIRPFLIDPHPLVRIAAIDALSAAPDTAAYLAAVAAYLADPRPRFRQVGFSSLVARASRDGAPAEVRAEAVRQTLDLAVSKDWTLRAAAIEGHALLGAEGERKLLETALADDPRVAKEAVEPYLRLRAGLSPGPLFERWKPEVETLAGAPDPVLRAVLLGAIGAVAADSAVGATGADWSVIGGFAGKMYRAARARDRVNDACLAAVELAALWPDDPELRALLRSAESDPNSIVRRAAATALRDAGETPPPPGPVATGNTKEDYRTILAWAAVDHWAVIETEGGRIVAKLFASDAPLTSWNFARLAESGYYDRGAWHRVVPDFVLQDGCPRGDGTGGPAWQIRCEINHRRYVTGALGMALSGKDTGGSQFFFTHSDQPHLDGRYTVFGQIESGQETADRIQQGSPIFSIRVVETRP